MTSRNFQVFPDTVLSDLNLTSCINTINGVCVDTKNLQECIDICRNSEKCNAGYFISTPDGLFSRQNICAPLFHHKNKSNTPYYRFRNKSVYPELRNSDAYVFSDTDMYPYPPDEANTMFYKDRFILKDIRTGVHIGMNDSGDLTQDLLLKNDTDDKEHIHVLQFLSSEITRDKVENYVYIRNGDSVVINVPNTAFVLKPRSLVSMDGKEGKEEDSKSESKKDGFVWVLALAGKNSFPFQVICKEKKFGEILNYNDVIGFYHNDLPVVFRNGLLTLGNNPNDLAIFTAIPKVEASYCDKGTCTKVELEKTDRTGYTATYKGSKVHRSPVCWNLCKSKSSIYSYGSSDRVSIYWKLALLCVYILVIVLIYRSV